MSVWEVFVGFSDDIKIMNAEEKIEELQKQKKMLLSYVNFKMQHGDYMSACTALQDINIIESKIEVWKNFTVL
jgi:hypothetical protein